MMRTHSGKLSVALAMIVGALAVSACSADDGSSPTGPGAGTGGTAAAPQYPGTSTSKDPAEKGIERLNEVRRLAGLGEVQVQNDGAYACEAHLDYLLWEVSNNKKSPCYLSHTEDNHNNPYYSVENENAGKNSVIACGKGSFGDQSLPEAVDMWINSLYHRLPLLAPGLTTIGWASKGGLNCINYRPGTTKTAAEAAVAWPPDKMVDVPRSFAGFEAPCPTKPDNPLATTGADCVPSGFIVTVAWNYWATSGPKAFAGSEPVVNLIDESTGNPVPLLVWFGDGVSGHDPSPGYVRDTIAIVPQQTLPQNTTFRVEIDATVAAQPTSYRSTFTTGTRDQ